MKLGLIQCDYVPTLLQSEFNDYPVMFERAFSEFDADLDWTVIDICAGSHDIEASDFDGFIISGSRSSVNDSKSWILLLLDLIIRIIEKEVPLVGLCFGHQIIDLRYFAGSLKLYCWGNIYRRSTSRRQARSGKARTQQGKTRPPKM